jgi:hypothetical protein
VSNRPPVLKTGGLFHYPWGTGADTNIQMNKSRPRFVKDEKKQEPHLPTHQTFEEWQTEQQRDARTPEQRGIKIGTSVLWRHRANLVIVTDRATVVAIQDNTLTLQVKDVETRICVADVHEIVDNQTGRVSASPAQ